MKVLVLGASGYIGNALLRRLQATGWARPVGTSRRPVSDASARISVDTRDPVALALSLRGYDCVVNCVAGDFDSIATGARILTGAAGEAGCRRIVHLSTMSVYGRTEGRVDERAALDPGLSWYARAKCEAESHMAAFHRSGGEVVILRPGCVYGPGSQLWVGRFGRWLQSGRLGDLGAAGDGWCNLVHVDDVCSAVIAALRLAGPPSESMPVFNLAAPDGPRWNAYFTDLALAIGATPVRRIRSWQLQLDSLIGGPPLKVAEKLCDRLGIAHRRLPEAMPPSIVRLWSQEIRLMSDAATRALGLNWIRYDDSRADFAAWFAECLAV